MLIKIIVTETYHEKEKLLHMPMNSLINTFQKFIELTIADITDGLKTLPSTNTTVNDSLLEKFS